MMTIGGMMTVLLCLAAVAGATSRIAANEEYSLNMSRVRRHSMSGGAKEKRQKEK
jgi:hypothetical protein